MALLPLVRPLLCVLVVLTANANKGTDAASPRHNTTYSSNHAVSMGWRLLPVDGHGRVDFVSNGTQRAPFIHYMLVFSEPVPILESSTGLHWRRTNHCRVENNPYISLSCPRPYATQQSDLGMHAVVFPASSFAVNSSTPHSNLDPARTVVVAFGAREERVNDVVQAVGAPTACTIRLSPALFNDGHVPRRNSTLLRAVAKPANHKLVLRHPVCVRKHQQSHAAQNLSQSEWKQLLATFGALSHEVLFKLQQFHTQQNDSIASSAKYVASDTGKPGFDGLHPHGTTNEQRALHSSSNAGSRRLLFLNHDGGRTVHKPHVHRQHDLEVLTSGRNLDAVTGDAVNLDRLQSAELQLLEVTSKLNAMAEGKLGLHSTTIYEVIINPCIQVFETLMPEILYWLLKEPIVAIIEWILEHLAFPSLFHSGMQLPWIAPGADIGNATAAKFADVLPRGSGCDPPCVAPLVCGPSTTCVRKCNPACQPPLVCGVDGECGHRCDPPCPIPLACTSSGKCSDTLGRLACNNFGDTCPVGQQCVQGILNKTYGRYTGLCADAQLNSTVVPRSFGRRIRIVSPVSTNASTAFKRNGTSGGQQVLPAELAIGNGDAMNGLPPQSFVETNSANEAHSARLLGIPSSSGMNLLQNFALSVSDGISAAMGDAVQEKLGHALTARLRAGAFMCSLRTIVSLSVQTHAISQRVW